MMTEKECLDYGKDVCPLWAAENPATYTPGIDSQYFIYQANPPSLIPREQFLPVRKEIRPIIIAEPKTPVPRPSPHFWRTLIVLLQRWIPRVNI